jgi:outer membrane lipoprotein SlyB
MPPAVSGLDVADFPVFVPLRLPSATKDSAVGIVIAKERAGSQYMKKAIAILISLFILSMTALPVAAQTRNRCTTRRTAQSRYYDRYNDRSAYRADRYRYDDYRYERDGSVWDQHRDKITTAAGAGGGAVLGALIGGKKGAVIGAIAGGAGAALYTYKIRDKNPRY